jgi:hypothetical protein
MVYDSLFMGFYGDVFIISEEELMGCCLLVLMILMRRSLPIELMLRNMGALTPFLRLLEGFYLVFSFGSVIYFN